MSLSQVRRVLWDASMNFARPLLLSAIAILFSSCASSDLGGGGVRTATFSHTLGSTTARDSGAKCSIGLSAPSGSPLKGQTVTFVLERSDGVSWTTQECPVATGSSKSQGELQAQLGNALRRGLTAPAGTELTKVGSAEHGGEVRLVARGGGSVDLAYRPALDGGNPVLSAGETGAFAQLLGK